MSAPQQNPLVPQTVSMTPITGGMNTYADPTVIPDKDFALLENVYPLRGRLQKMAGSTSIGRLRRAFSEMTYFDSGSSPWSFNLLAHSGYITDISGATPTFTVTTNGPHKLSSTDEVVIQDVTGTIGADVNGNTYAVTVVTPTTFTISLTTTNTYTSGGFYISDSLLTTDEPNASLECGSFEMVIDGETFTDNGDGTITGDMANSGTINYASGAVTITGATGSVATTLSYAYFPTLPVMGLHLYDEAFTNEAESIAFDQRYAYILDQSTGNWGQRGTKSWDSSTKDFFGAYVYQRESGGSASFRQIVWNYNIEESNVDSFQYWDGSDWAAFSPDIDGTNFLFTAQFLTEYYGRLVAFDTWEGATIAGATRYQNRLRASAISDPFASTAWRSDTDNPGKGYTIDAPTSSAIRAVGKHAGQIIVGFASGEIYYIKYTGNDLFPFVWEQIGSSTDFGGIAPFGTADLFEGEFMIGPNGASVVNSRNAERVDMQIPDWIFNIADDEDGGQRTHTVKDLQRELLYITYPRGSRGGVFPERMACYNYREKLWSFLHGQYTCLGYYQKQSDYTWATLPYEEWDDWIEPWGSSRSQAFYTDVIGGNQVGYVSILNAEGENDPSFPITSMADSVSANEAPVIGVPDHNLIDGEAAIAVLSGIQGSTEDEALNDVRVRLFYVTESTLGVQTLVDGEWSNYFLENSAYLGCGEVSWVYGFKVRTKAYSPYYDVNGQVRLQYFDTQNQVNEDAEMTYRVYMNTQFTEPVTEGIIGLGLERSDISSQTHSWHRVDPKIEGQNLMVELTVTDEQLGTASNAQQPWQMIGMRLMLRPGKRFI